MTHPPRFRATAKDYLKLGRGDFEEFIVERHYAGNHHKHDEDKWNIMFDAIKDYFATPKSTEIKEKNQPTKAGDKVNHKGNDDCDICNGSGIVYCSDGIYSHCEECCGEYFPENCAKDCAIKLKLKSGKH